MNKQEIQKLIEEQEQLKKFYNGVSRTEYTKCEFKIAELKQQLNTK